MKQVAEMENQKLIPTSVLLSKEVREQLRIKAENLGLIGISKIIRMLVDRALKNGELDFSNFFQKKSRSTINGRLENRLLKHAVSTYYLVREQVLESGERGVSLNNIAHQKAKEVVEKILSE